MPTLLRAETAYFDAHEFDPPGGPGLYEDLSPFNRKLAHIGLHVGNIAMEKLVLFRTHNRMALMHDEIIPDLVLYATQLATLFDIPDENFEVEPRPFNFTEVDDRVRLAGAAFTKYIEPREHEPAPVDRAPFVRSSKMLYSSALAFGIEYGMADVAGAQLRRMERKLGHKIPRPAAAEAVA